VSLVNHEDGFDFTFLNPVNDLEEKSVLSGSWGFTQLRDDHSEKSGGGDMGEMDVDRAGLIFGHGVFEDPQKRRLSDAGLTDNEGQVSLAPEELQSGQGLVKPLVIEDPLVGRIFGKRVNVQVEMG
jgi:hypothetical protein